MVKNLPANAGEVRDEGSIPGLGRSPGVGNGNPPLFLPGKSHGQRSLAGYSPCTMIMFSLVHILFCINASFSNLPF